MNYLNIFALTQQAGVENPSLFPFPFKMHLIFACIGAIFFAYRFFTQKRPYQLIMAIAIPASLIIWLSESRTLFYGLGIAEAVLILAAAVTSIIFRAPAESEDDEESEEAEESGDEEDADAESKESETEEEA